MPLYEFKGKRPTVAPDAWIAPTAVLIGDVTVKSGASVWWGSVLRGDVDRIEIGERSNVQDNCTIHVDHDEPTIIGPDVTIGHMALVHSAIVEANVLIGSASVLVGGNTVGTCTVIGAGAVLPEGFDAPSHSLVLGVPARVVRKVTPADERLTHGGADRYAKLSAYYREHVREVPSS